MPRAKPFDFKDFADFCKKVYKINCEIVNAAKYYDRMWAKANKHLQNTFNKETGTTFKLYELCTEIDPFNAPIDNVLLTGSLKSKKSNQTIYLEMTLPLTTLMNKTWVAKIDDFLGREVQKKESEEKLIFERLQKKFKNVKH